MIESSLRTVARIPDFFIVGQPKSGTTSLWEMLRQHPKIYMPELKEPYFLGSDLGTRFRPAFAGPSLKNLEEYLELFARSTDDQIAGEASVYYLFSEDAASNIARLNDRAKVIAIFREPAAFLHSLHQQLLSDHNESVKSLRRALQLEALRADGHNVPKRSYRPQVLQYSRHLEYSAQLARFQAALRSEQILVIIYDDYRADNKRVLGQIGDFLGVAGLADLSTAEANPSTTLRSQVLDDALHRISVGRGPYSQALKAVVKGVTPKELRARMMAQARRFLSPPPPPLDAALALEIRRKAKPEVERFSNLIGRDLLSLWGYDRI